jgi:hypothetical protein
VTVGSWPWLRRHGLAGAAVVLAGVARLIGLAAGRAANTERKRPESAPVGLSSEQQSKTGQDAPGADVEALKRAREEADRKATQAAAENTRLTAATADLQTRLDKLAAEQPARKEELTAAARENTRLTAAAADLQKRLDKLEGEHAAREKDLRAAKSENAQLKADLNKAQTNRAALIRDFLRDVINVGAERYNPPFNDYLGCYLLYRSSLVIVRPHLHLYPELQQAIDRTFAEVDRRQEVRWWQMPKDVMPVYEKAFALRKTIDLIRKTLQEKPNP